MSHRSAFRIAHRSVSMEAYSVIVESQRTRKMLLFQSSAVTTISNSEALSKLRRSHTKLMDARGLVGVLRTGQDDAHLLAVTEDESVGELRNCKIYRIWGVSAIPLKGPSANITDPRINDVLRLFSSGSFYYATQDDPSRCIDLTVRSQKCSSAPNGDGRFFWNKHLHFPLKRYKTDPNEWLLRMICGSVIICQVYVGQQRATVALISRLSCERVGTRFNVRGVDDAGHVANFVETEQIVILDTDEVSFVQIRGSVPLFWEQPGINVGSHKVKLRAFEASAPAFNRHFRLLTDEYAEVTVVNLLGSREGETLLSKAYEAHYKNSRYGADYIVFDYHEEKRNTVKLMDRLKPTILRCMFYMQRNGNVLRIQNGVIRINCLDCLDRTNAVQTLIGFQVLTLQLESLAVDKKYFPRFEEHLKDIWQRNGDACSVIYAGTGALEGKSKVKDARRTLVRTIQNNFLDASKQEAFDFLLHGAAIFDCFFNQLTRMMPREIVQECPTVAKDIAERKLEMVDTVPLTIWIGTWNINGGKNLSDITFRNQTNLSDWLFPQHLIEVAEGADVYVVGLEEIIDLNASNIVSASTTNQRAWAAGLREALLEHSKYVLMGCEQLVGVCIFVFIKPFLAPAVRDLAINSVKTGMGGATGNKGSVAISLTIHSTTFCFVCSHLAAGQNEVRDRNEDYMNALRKIKFPQGRGILSHDVVFWLGDFNYRITLSRDEAEAAIKSGNFLELSRYDQLSQQKALGELSMSTQSGKKRQKIPEKVLKNCETLLSKHVFKDFEEGPVIFAPTYKYDTFSDEYDTSEKCRVPAWTDRVLWRETNATKIVQLLGYDRVELKSSDHRPVFALFRVNAYKIILSQVELIYKDVISELTTLLGTELTVKLNICSSMGPPDGTVLVSVTSFDTFPLEFYDHVIGKLGQLGISPSISNMALAALSLDGIKIGDSVLSVHLLTPDWVEFECAQMSNMMQNAKEETNVDCIELGNADNFEINDGDDISVKGEFDDRIPKPKSASPPDRSEADLCRLDVPNIASRSVSSPSLNDIPVNPVADNVIASTAEPKLPVPSAVPTLIQPVQFSIAPNAPPPVPPRRESARK